jgi:hypothetical protein
LIENPDIPKMGVNILSTPMPLLNSVVANEAPDDGKKLFRDYGILAQNLVELGALATVADPTAKSRRKIVSLAKVCRSMCFFF